jgi:hypothetical protein
MAFTHETRVRVPDRELLFCLLVPALHAMLFGKSIYNKRGRLQASCLCRCLACAELQRTCPLAHGSSLETRVYRCEGCLSLAARLLLLSDLDPGLRWWWMVEWAWAWAWAWAWGIRRPAGGTSRSDLSFVWTGKCRPSNNPM